MPGLRIRCGSSCLRAHPPCKCRRLAPRPHPTESPTTASPSPRCTLSATTTRWCLGTPRCAWPRFSLRRRHVAHFAFSVVVLGSPVLRVARRVNPSQRPSGLGGLFVCVCVSVAHAESVAHRGASVGVPLASATSKTATRRGSASGPSAPVLASLQCCVVACRLQRIPMHCCSVARCARRSWCTATATRSPRGRFVLNRAVPCVRVVVCLSVWVCVSVSVVLFVSV